MNLLSNLLQTSQSQFNVATTAKRVIPQTNEISILTTKSKFKIGGLVTRALEIAPQDSVMLVNNVAAVDAMIAEPTAEMHQLAQVATEYGAPENYEDANDPSFKTWFRGISVSWCVAKGYPLYEKDGSPVKAVTKDDAKEEYHKCQGSRTNKLAVGGFGNALDFTDAGSYNTLKADLIKDGTSDLIVRSFEVDLDNPIVQEMHNGVEAVKVTLYPIKLDTLSDKEVEPRKKSESSKTAAPATDVVEGEEIGDMPFDEADENPLA